MNNSKEIKRFVTNLEDERNSIALYLALAKIEKDPKLAQVYERLAKTEQHHADTWTQKIRAAGETVPPFRAAWRTRTLIWLAQRFGVRAVLPSISALEDAGSNSYSQQSDATALIATEQSHARVLRQINESPKRGIDRKSVV